MQRAKHPCAAALAAVATIILALGAFPAFADGLPDYYAAQVARLAGADPRVEAHVGRNLVAPAMDRPVGGAADAAALLDRGGWRRLEERGAVASGFVSVYESLPPLRTTKATAFFDRVNLFIGVLAERGGLADWEPTGDRVDVRVHTGFSPADTPLKLSLSGDGSLRTLQMPNGARERWTAEVQLGADAWQGVIAIPFSALGRTRPEQGAVWGLNIVRRGLPGDYESSWAPIRRAELDETWGWLHFGHGVPVDDATLLGRRIEHARPDPFELEYLSVREKRAALTLDRPVPEAAAVRLFWRTPDGRLREIEEPESLEVDGNRIEARFRHPLARRDGSYGLEVFVADGGGVRWVPLHFDREALVRAGVRAQREKVAAARAVENPPEAPLRMGREELDRLLAIVPERAGFADGRRDNASPAAEGGLLRWDAANPHQLTCSESGTVFPNEAYPNTGAFLAANLRGELVEYPYHQDAAGRRYYIEPYLWLRQLNHVVAKIGELAEPDPAAAGALLFRLAQVFPNHGYFLHGGNGMREGDRLARPGAPFPRMAAPWRPRRWNSVRRILELAEAYEKVRRTDAFDRLSERHGVDAAFAIEFGMIRPTVEFIRTYAIRGVNREPYIFVALAQLGRLLGEPDYLHGVEEKTRRFAAGELFFDSFYREVSISYHNQATRSLWSAVRAIEGWTDPPGYESPRTGRRYDEPDFAAEFPHLMRAQEVRNDLAFPDRQCLTIQDTWGYVRGRAPQASTPLIYPAAALARLGRGEGSYHRRTEDGLRDGSDQIHVYLTAPPKFDRGKRHHDPLNLTLFAKGQELLPDLGYSHTPYRFAYMRSTFGHNTVVVDGRDIHRVGNTFGGSFELFAPVDEDLQIMAAIQPTYGARAVLDEYRRELWLVGAGEGREYILDIFRVEGGGRHEYTLHGASRHRSEMEADVPLPHERETLLPDGVGWREPRSETDTGFVDEGYFAYAMFRDLGYGPLERGDYLLALNTLGEHEQLRRPAGDPDTRVRLRIFGSAEGGAGDTLYIGRAPSMKSTRHRDRTGDRNHDQYWMPKMVVRREGEGLRSEFVFVMEPSRYKYRHGAGDWRPLEDRGRHGPHIERVRVFRSDELDEGAKGDVAVLVEHGEYRDWLLSSNSPESEMAVGVVRFTGSRAFVRERGGDVARAAMVGGTSLRIGGRQWQGNGSVSGGIVATRRAEDEDEGGADGFVVDAEVDERAAGGYMVVVHPEGTTYGAPGTRSHGRGDERRHPIAFTRIYEIASVTPDEGGRTFVETTLHPEFDLHEDGSASMRFYPHLDWPADAEHRFRIDYVDVFEE